MTQLRINITKDGSPSLYKSDLDEHYHSTHGALTESQHVFIKEGLLYYLSKQVHLKHSLYLLEVGVGTGLNYALTAEYAKAHKIPLIYHGVEPYPPQLELLEQYFTLLPQALLPHLNKVAKAMHNEEANNTIRLWKQKLEEVELNHTYDIIYFDAFAPDKQPELWELSIFNKLRSALKPGGMLTTYSSKGQVKRNMLGAGLQVTKVPGPPGKREMLRAIKPI